MIHGLFVDWKFDRSVKKFASKAVVYEVSENALDFAHFENSNT